MVNAARQCIGTPFRPQGRLPGTGLDCVGLAAVAVRAGGCEVHVPADYDLSGEARDRLSATLDALGLCHVAGGIIQPGDILLFRPARYQQHLGIATEGGFVHAHLGLRKVVETPRPAPWPLAGVWRVKAKG